MSMIHDALRRASPDGGEKGEVGRVTRPEPSSLTSLSSPLAPLPSNLLPQTSGKGWMVLVAALLLLIAAGAAGAYLWKNGRLSSLQAWVQKLRPGGAQAKVSVAVAPKNRVAAKYETVGEVIKQVALRNSTSTVSNSTAQARSAPSAAPVAAAVAPVSPPISSLSSPASPAVPVDFPQLRLQGIYFRPPNPSVLISGRTLYLQDQIKGVTVAAIDATSVTLVLSGRTNVLTLR